MNFPKIDKKKTGARIKFFMYMAGLTPNDIAAYLSLGCVQTVYRWFEGVNLPTVDNLYALSELFQIPVDDMLEGARKYNRLKQGMDCTVRLFLYYKKISEINAA